MKRPFPAAQQTHHMQDNPATGVLSQILFHGR
jgi:hypothetical protein